MKTKFFAFALLVSLVSSAQNKVDIDLGVNGSVFLTKKPARFHSGSPLTYGAHLSARITGGKAAVGLGVEPTYLPTAEVLLIPVYADLRYAIFSDLEILGQGGYHFYNFDYTSVYNSPYLNWEGTKKGGLYATAGLNYYVPMKTNRMHITAKYVNYSFRNTTKIYRNTSAFTTSKSSNRESTVSLGVGITL
jgi:hypothetical protein